MALVQKRSNHRQKSPTNSPDWSSLIPILPGAGPRAKQLYRAVRQLIETGRVPPGAKLPTTRDLAGRLGLSRAAAVAAFEHLAAEGFLEARVGAGTFVARDVPQLSAASPGEVPVPRGEATDLTGTMGLATPDPRTFAIFRKLLGQSLRTLDPVHFRYGDPRGGIELREAIAAYLRTARGVRCTAADILITSGTQQALDLLARAMLTPGDRVWLEDPCYPAARKVLRAAGAEIVGVVVDDEGLDVQAGEAAAPDARAVYVTPSHQYPLGVTLSMRRRLALIDWAKRADAWIIEDDYDSEFRYAGPPLAALQGMDGAGRVAYLGTFAKVLFPGLRVGYAVLPEPLLTRVLDLRARSDRQPPTLTEGALAGLIAQGHFAAHLRRARRRAEAARDALVAGLFAGPSRQLTLMAPTQGLHLVVNLSAECDDRAIEAALREAGVAALALSPLHIDRPPRPGLVLGFSGFSAEALTAAAATIHRIVG